MGHATPNALPVGCGPVADGRRAHGSAPSAPRGSDAEGRYAKSLDESASIRRRRPSWSGRTSRRPCRAPACSCDTVGDPQQPTFRKAVGQGFSDLMSVDAAARSSRSSPTATLRDRSGSRSATRASAAAPDQSRSSTWHGSASAFMARSRSSGAGSAMARSRAIPSAAAALSAVPSLGSATSEDASGKDGLREHPLHDRARGRGRSGRRWGHPRGRAAPARRKLGFAGFRLDLGPFLDLAGAIEGSLATAPGATPAPTMNAPLPD